MIGITAFKTSKDNVLYPSNLLPALKAFVAPIFPEPIFLISLPIKVLVKISPKGIEPNKYEIIIIKVKWFISIIKF